MITKKDVLVILKDLQKFVESHGAYWEDDKVVFAREHCFSVSSGFSIQKAKLIITEDFIRQKNDKEAIR